jgi:hypothetical protein
MTGASLLAASLAVAIMLTAGSAFAQTAAPSATRAAPWVQTGDAAYPPPPNAPPAGTHYEWIFSYDRHGNYLGHWQTVRDN